MEAVDVLTIAAHPDDIELTCAGTLIKMVDKGYSVGILDLTHGELGTRGTPEIRAQEAEAARVTIRITRAHRKAIVVKRTVAAGAVALKLKHRLAHGRYAIRVLAVDTAGNRSAPAIVRRRV